MHDEELCRLFEKRLRDEAVELLDAAPPKSLIVGLRVAFVRRRQRHRLARTLFASATIVAIVLIGTTWIQRPRGENENLATDARIFRATGAVSAEVEVEVEPDDFFAVGDVYEGELRRLQSSAIPILFAQTGQDGNQEFRVGWYVPEQVEALDTDKLVPAERDALSRLLGSDFDVRDDETI